MFIFIEILEKSTNSSQHKGNNKTEDSYLEIRRTKKIYRLEVKEGSRDHVLG